MFDHQNYAPYQAHPSQAVDAPNPNAANMCQNAYQAYKQGQYAQSVQLFEQAFNQGMLPVSMELSFGWALYRQCGALLSAPTVKIPEITHLFWLFTRLPSALQPNLLASCMFTHLSRLCDELNDKLDPTKKTNKQFSSWQSFDPVGIMAAIGLHNLREEDFKPSQGKDGKTYPAKIVGLMHNVAKFELNLIKSLESENNPNPNRQLLLQQNLAKCDYLAQQLINYRKYDQTDYAIWLDYYIGQLLYRAKRYNDAAIYYQKLVTQKSKDYWIWQRLAECYTHIGYVPQATSISPALHQAACCWAKAIMCTPQSSVLPKLYSNAAWAFRAGHYFGLAMFLEQQLAQGDDAVLWAPKSSGPTLFVSNIAAQENGEVSPALKIVMKDSVPQPEQVQAALQEMAASAQELLFSEQTQGQKWYPANLGPSFKLESKNKYRRKLYVRCDDNDIAQVVTMPDDAGFKGLKEGTALEVRVQDKPREQDKAKGDLDRNNPPLHNWQVMQVRLRPDGKEWDVVPLKAVLITSVDELNSKYRFKLNQSVFGTIPFRFMPKKLQDQQLQKGDYIEARLIVQVKKGFNVYQCNDIAYPTDIEPSHELENIRRKLK